jgi:Leucine-rich repeat (LRR) protein
METRNIAIKEKIKFFTQKAGVNKEKSYLDFLYLVAQPMLFSTDLLYKLWVNFKSYAHKEVENQANYLIVSDLILSGLSQPIGADLFRLDEELREFLLKNNNMPDKLSAEVAHFVEEYISRNKANLSKNIYEIHRIWSMAQLKPLEMENMIKDLLGKEELSNNEKVGYLCLYYDSMPFDEKSGGQLGITIKYADKDDNINILYASPQKIRSLEKRIQADPIRENEPSQKSNAYQLIQENLRTKNPYLDLGNCGLDGTEPELELLAECTHLETLIFSNEWWEFDDDKKESVFKHSQNQGKKNNLFELTPFFPSNLKKLILAGDFGNNWKINNISNLSFLKKLLYVDLKRNNIDNISPLKELKELQSLDLSWNNNIQEISVIKDFKVLKALGLAFNKITEFTLDFLDSLPNLQELYLHNNPIDNLPQEIIKDWKNCLDDLKKYFSEIKKPQVILDLERRLNIQLVNVDIDQISNLSFETAYSLNQKNEVIGLTIRDQHLSDISFIQNFKNLQKLYLGGNNIKQVNDLKGLTDLVRLGLKYNQISEISLDFIESLPSLQVLYLKGNPIQNIPKEIFDKEENYLEDLKKYFSQNSQIQTIFGSTIEDAKKIIQEAKEKKLIRIDLGRLGITDLNEIPELFELNWLEELMISNQYWDYKTRKWIHSDNNGELNKVSRTPKDFEKLENLKVLQIGGSFIYKNDINIDNWEINNIELLSSLKNLEYLDIRNSNVKDLSFITELHKLEFLDASWNKINNISFLSSLTSVNSIDISGNEIVDFSYLGNLELIFLDLSYCNIKDISFLEKLETIRVLYLKENEIVNIEKLQNLRSLEVIDLSSNKIIYIPRNFIALKNLQSLLIRNNPVANIPKEIFNVVGNCLDEVKKYFFETQSQTTFGSTISDARKIIQEAKEKKLKKLDLANLGLTSLEELPELFELKDLEVLQLGEYYFDWENNSLVKTQNTGQPNRIKQISPKIHNLLNINALYFRNIGLESVFFLRNLRNKRLKVLDISENTFNEMMLFAQVYNKKYQIALEELSLANCNMKGLQNFDLVKNVRFEKLKRLDLSGLPILPHAKLLKDFPNIEKLKLADNQLNSIGFLSELKSLISLDVRNNQINEISPDFINSLPNLQELYLQGNLIKNIPNEIFEREGNCLEEIRKYLSENQKPELILNFENFLKITLNLVSISELGNLKNKTAYSCNSSNKVIGLSLRGLRLQDVDFLANAKDLEILYLNDNELINPYVLNYLKRLSKLWLNNNKIVFFSPFFLEQNSNLKELYLQENPIENIPLEIYDKDGNCLDSVRMYFNDLEFKKRFSTNIRAKDIFTSYYHQGTGKWRIDRGALQGISTEYTEKIRFAFYPLNATISSQTMITEAEIEELRGNLTILKIGEEDLSKLKTEEIYQAVILNQPPPESILYSELEKADNEKVIPFELFELTSEKNLADYWLLIKGSQTQIVHRLSQKIIIQSDGDEIIVESLRIIAYWENTRSLYNPKTKINADELLFDFFLIENGVEKKMDFQNNELHFDLKKDNKNQWEVLECKYQITNNTPVDVFVAAVIISPLYGVHYMNSKLVPKGSTVSMNSFSGGQETSTDKISFWPGTEADNEVVVHIKYLITTNEDLDVTPLLQEDFNQNRLLRDRNMYLRRGSGERFVNSVAKKTDLMSDWFTKDLFFVLNKIDSQPITKNVFNSEFIKRFNEATASEIPELLGILQNHYEQIPSHQRGIFNQLKSQFIDQPNNFRLSNWKAQFITLIREFKFKIEIPDKTIPIETKTQSSNPNQTSNTPVVFTAFANPDGDLKNLSEEQNGIQESLLALDHQQIIKHLIRTDTDLEAYFTFLRQYKNQISIFHFAGHANSEALSLQNAPTFFEPLAKELVGRNKRSLQLVFLNGCSTYAHVQTLFKLGVLAVIATSVDVADDLAMKFAVQFYENLAEGDDIPTAYESAANFAKASSQETRFRFLGSIKNWGEVNQNEQVFPWGLYIQEGVSLEGKGLMNEVQKNNSKENLKVDRKTLMKLLEESFNENDLDRFFFINEEFKDIHNYFAKNQTKFEKIMALITYCERKSTTDILLQKIREENLTAYKKHIK